MDVYKSCRPESPAASNLFTGVRHSTRQMSRWTFNHTRKTFHEWYHTHKHNFSFHHICMHAKILVSSLMSRLTSVKSSIYCLPAWYSKRPRFTKAPFDIVSQNIKGFLTCSSTEKECAKEIKWIRRFWYSNNTKYTIFQPSRSVKFKILLSRNHKDVLLGQSFHWLYVESSTIFY